MIKREEAFLKKNLAKNIYHIRTKRKGGYKKNYYKLLA